MILRAEVVVDRLRRPRQVVRNLREVRTGSQQAFVASFRHYWLGERGLQLAAETLLDAGNHVLAAHFNVHATDYEDVVRRVLKNPGGSGKRVLRARARRGDESMPCSIVEEPQRRHRPQPPLARRVTPEKAHLRRCPSSTMGKGIAFVGAPCICAFSDVTRPIRVFQHPLRRLAEHDVISHALAERLRGIGGFRNVLVHEYTNVDLVRVYRFLHEGLDDFLEFADQVDAFVESVRPPEE